MEDYERLRARLSGAKRAVSQAIDFLGLTGSNRTTLRRFAEVADEASDAIDLLERQRNLLRAECDILLGQRNHQRAKRRKHKARVKQLGEALLWCSGSNDFNEGGVARAGWLKICAPLLAELQEDKSHE